METLFSPTAKQGQAILEGLAFLSRIFHGPDGEFCENMIRGDCLHPFEVLAPLMTFDPPGALAEINALITMHADPDSLFEALETSYVRLFISNRGGISAPLYQSCYTETDRPGKSGLLMGKAAVDMKRRLASAGLSLDENIGQMADHLSIEIEYLYFLLQKIEDQPGCPLPRGARSFAATVMLPWVSRLRNRIDAEPEDFFYPRMASLLISTLNLISSLQRHP